MDASLILLAAHVERVGLVGGEVLQEEGSGLGHEVDYDMVLVAVDGGVVNRAGLHPILVGQRDGPVQDDGVRQRSVDLFIKGAKRQKDKISGSL